MNAVTGMLILYIIIDALVSQVIRINICHTAKKQDEKFFPLSSLSFPCSMTRLLIADGAGKCLLLCAQLHSYVLEIFYGSMNFRYKVKFKMSRSNLPGLHELILNHRNEHTHKKKINLKS